MSILADYETFITRVCAISREVTIRYFRQPAGLTFKQDESPVTLADKEIESRIRELIRKEYPNYGILGEEFGAENTDAEYVFTLDPIDGTKSFITGIPVFGTLLALSRKGQPVLGLIYQAVTDDLVVGDNQTAFWNKKKTVMRPTPPLNESVVLTTDIMGIAKHHNLQNFLKLSEQVRFMRTWGDAYGYFLLAAGFADIMLDPVMNPWDILAVVPVIQGAGGKITDWQGNDAATGKNIIAAQPQLHQQVLEILHAQK